MCIGILQTAGLSDVRTDEPEADSSIPSDYSLH